MSDLPELIRSLLLLICGGAVAVYWMSVKRAVERTDANVKAIDELAKQLAPGFENLNIIANEIEKRMEEEADDETTT